MKISRFLKTIFLLEFVSGLLIAIREIFRPKKTKQRKTQYMTQNQPNCQIYSRNNSNLKIQNTNQGFCRL